MSCGAGPERTLIGAARTRRPLRSGKAEFGEIIRPRNGPQDLDVEVASETFSWVSGTASSCRSAAVGLCVGGVWSSPSTLGALVSGSMNCSKASNAMAELYLQIGLRTTPASGGHLARLVPALLFQPQIALHRHADAPLEALAVALDLPH